MPPVAIRLRFVYPNTDLEPGAVTMTAAAELGADPREVSLEILRRLGAEECEVPLAKGPPFWLCTETVQELAVWETNEGEGSRSRPPRRFSVRLRGRSGPA